MKHHLLILAFWVIPALSIAQKSFVSEQKYKANLAKHLKMTPQTLAQLRKQNVTETTELRLEYYLYTNTAKKARDLAGQIQKFGDKIESSKDPSNSGLYFVTGWTSKMKMSETQLLEWTRVMCDLGYEFDAVFDGWKITPIQ